MGWLQPLISGGYIKLKLWSLHMTLFQNHKFSSFSCYVSNLNKVTDLLMNFDLIPCGGVNQHSTVPHRTELHRASNIMPCTLCVCFVGVFTVRIDFTTRCSIKIHFTLQPRKLGVKADKFPRRNLTLPPNPVHRGLKSVGIDFTPPMFWIGV